MAQITKDKRLVQYFPLIISLITTITVFHVLKSIVYNDLLENRYLNTPKMKNANDACKDLRGHIESLRNEITMLKMMIVADDTKWNDDLNNLLSTKIVNALDNFYSDQNGLMDYAATYSGGSIVSTPDTRPYVLPNILGVFAVFQNIMEAKPSTVLEPTVVPGQCFPFYGSKGRIRIKLGRPIIITHISMEHLRMDDRISTSPKNFQVMGLNEDEHFENLGNFVYNLSNKIIQTFPVLPKNKTFHVVELQIFSNYGNEVFTCLYRFRVHSIFKEH